ncbi:MAG: 16S rRNA (cytidine(1402)-2'-O)-methyltransferase [Bryobacter sp.]|nr:16S rRNA (cytidine(1402)-2'-O)-methyltransferase [Bryobacter sp.]
MAGVLYIVATPIGNLEDLTRRACRILGEVAAVACEDTRQSGKLMEAIGAQRPLISLHEHNEEERSSQLVARLLAGEDLALISDAGTPLVSDPGFRLVQAALAAGVKVVPLPGPSAPITALSASGLETDAFAFIGFLPHKAKARREVLEGWSSTPATLIFFESPHRIVETLADLVQLFGERPVVLARELTKLHEEFLRGTAAELRDALATRPSIKGEFTVLVGRERQGPASNLSAEEILSAYRRLLADGVEHMKAVKAVAQQTGRPKREVYEIITKG